ncbi:SPARC-like [Lineus longissimus]|uniref:SPARC-like n=1 Tax=Lineus longissimus TaxID=88925 RepID=UPI002B4F5A1F
MKLLFCGICLFMVVGCFAQDDRPTDLPDAPPVEESPEPTEPPYVDPCEGITCEKGQLCQDDDKDGKGECVCNTYCDPVPDRSRYQCCSNQGETFPSLCALERDRCLCEKGHADCKKSQRKNAELAYYGACNANRQECTDDDMDLFMERMFRWYPLALYDRARAGTLTFAELSLARRVARNSDIESQYSLSSQWLFCNFDADNDGKVTRDESLIFTAQLQPLESCASKFILGCDTSGDKVLAYSEWQKCLGLEGDEMIDLCADLARENGDNPEAKKK